MANEMQQKIMVIHERWARVMDNASYIGVEHRHKEKEYGIKWRTAFKVQLHKETDKMLKKYGITQLTQAEEEDPTVAIFNQVQKDYNDIMNFVQGSQYDLVEMLQENLEYYENLLGYLRKILKNPYLHMELAGEPVPEKRKF